jgi:hypothetical protein
LGLCDRCRTSRKRRRQETGGLAGCGLRIARHHAIRRGRGLRHADFFAGGRCAGEARNRYHGKQNG